MRRWIIMAISLLIYAQLPSGGTELSSLRPVGVLRVQSRSHQVVLKTDTQDAGSGETLEEAIENLKDSSLGTVYLDTVQYLLIDKTCNSYLPQLQEILRPCVVVAQSVGVIDLKEAGQYLSVHRIKQYLKDSDDALAVLKEEGSGFTLEYPDNATE